jgi:hypothetical protein
VIAAFFRLLPVAGTRHALAVEAFPRRRESTTSVESLFEDISREELREFGILLEPEARPRRTLIHRALAAPLAALRRSLSPREEDDLVAYDAIDEIEAQRERELDRFIAGVDNSSHSLEYDDVDLDELADAFDELPELEDRANDLVNARADHEGNHFAVHRVIRVASIADSLTFYRRAPIRATAEHEFWRLGPLARQERREGLERTQETSLFDADTTSIGNAPAAVLPPPLPQNRAENHPSRSAFAAAATQQGNRADARPRRASHRRQQRSHHQRSPQYSTPTGRTGVDCRVGGIFAPRPTHPSPFYSTSPGRTGFDCRPSPVHIARKVDRPSLMELKFELDTRLTVSGIVVIAVGYGFTTVSVAIGNGLLAFAYAIILLFIIFILFGLRDILTRKSSPSFR